MICVPCSIILPVDNFFSQNLPSYFYLKQAIIQGLDRVFKVE